MLLKILESIKNNIIFLLNWKSIKKEIAGRKGYCCKCGVCCDRRCPLFNKNTCGLYFLRPFTCRLAPLKKDYKEKKWKEQGCTYYWEK